MKISYEHFNPHTPPSADFLSGKRWLFINSCNLPQFLDARCFKTSFFKGSKNDLANFLINYICTNTPGIFYYTPWDMPRQKTILSSISATLASRDSVYTNPHIHDLYLIHELAHLAHWLYTTNSIDKSKLDNLSYEEYTKLLSENEMWSSIISEAVVYFFTPSLLDKTFDDLWIKEFNPALESSKKTLLNCPQIFFDPQKWPADIKTLYIKRQGLRDIVDPSNTCSIAQQKIVKYNAIHQKWLLTHTSYYLQHLLVLKQYLQNQSPQLLFDFITSPQYSINPEID